MFECLVGWPPFCAEDAHDTYRKIVNWRSSLYFPDENPLLQSREAEQWECAEDCIRRYVPSFSQHVAGLLLIQPSQNAL